MSPSQIRVRLNGFPRNTCRYVLNSMKDWNSTTYLGSLFQCLTLHKATEFRISCFRLVCLLVKTPSLSKKCELEVGLHLLPQQIKLSCMLWFNCLAFSGFLVILRSIWISEETDLFWLCIICWREELFFSVCQKWSIMCQTFYIPDFLCWKCLFGAVMVSCKKFCNVHFDLFCLITVPATSWLLKLLQ